MFVRLRSIYVAEYIAEAIVEIEHLDRVGRINEAVHFYFGKFIFLKTALAAATWAIA